VPLWLVFRRPGYYNGTSSATVGGALPDIGFNQFNIF
jgi:hypothetical protein